MEKTLTVTFDRETEKFIFTNQGFNNFELIGLAEFIRADTVMRTYSQSKETLKEEPTGAEQSTAPAPNKPATRKVKGEEFLMELTFNDITSRHYVLKELRERFNKDTWEFDYDTWGDCIRATFLPEPMTLTIEFSKDNIPFMTHPIADRDSIAGLTHIVNFLGDYQ